MLIIDLPPGTGDIQLTLVQRLKLDGVVIVSTPQEIALIDARRAATMFRKTGAAILGVVENMAYFPDPAGGAPIPIFGHGGAGREALRWACRCWARCPSTSACVRPATRVGRWSPRRPKRAAARSSSRWRSGCSSRYSAGFRGGSPGAAKVSSAPANEVRSWASSAALISLWRCGVSL